MNKLELKSCTATESCIMDPVQLRARGLTDSVCVCIHGQRLSVSACVHGRERVLSKAACVWVTKSALVKAVK